MGVGGIRGCLGCWVYWGWQQVYVHSSKKGYMWHKGALTAPRWCQEALGMKGGIGCRGCQGYNWGLKEV